MVGADVDGRDQIATLRALIVDPLLERRRAIGERLRGFSNVTVSESDSVETGLASLGERGPRSKRDRLPLLRLLLVGATFADMEALSLVEAGLDHPDRPAVVVVGALGDARRAFDLARAGVHAVFRDQPSLEDLLPLLTEPSTIQPGLRALVKREVGRLTWKQIQVEVRRAVVNEALERAHGSRRSAARILGLSRTAVQRILADE